VAKNQQKAPFYLKDDTGVIRIIPDGAEIQDKQIFNKTCRFSDPLYFAKGPLPEIADSDHERRFIETAIPLHANLYVMGQARQREDIVAAEITNDKNCPMFLISTRTEKQISSGLGIWFWGWLVIGLLAIIGGVWLSSIVFRPFQPLSGQLFLIAAGAAICSSLSWAGCGWSTTA